MGREGWDGWLVGGVVDFGEEDFGGEEIRTVL